MEMYVDLSNLPIKKHRGKSCIDWKKSINTKIKFRYKDIYGEFYICDIIFDGKHTDILLKYNNRIEKISSYNLLHNKITRLMDKFLKKYVIGFRYEIGHTIIDEKRDITIIDRFPRNKNSKKILYKYKCNKCGYSNGVISQDGLMCGKGCGCCDNKIVVEGINDIPTIAPWMIDYFQNGYEEAKKYTYGSGVRKFFKCPHCGKIRNKLISIDRLYKTHSIGCTCGDGRSYPEKIMSNLLETINVDFIYQFSPKWLRGYNGSSRPAMFDFCVPSKKIIIEMDGMIGHGNYVMKNSISTIEDTMKKDKWKDEQAKKNGYNVIRIDSMFSNIDYIKNNIMKSNISLYFDLSNVDWDMIDRLSTKNLIKEICLYFDKNNNLTQKEIAKKYKITPQTVRKYLLIGSKFGWCKYNIKQRKCNDYPVKEYNGR